MATTKKAGGAASTNMTPDEQRFVDDHADGLSRSTQRAKWTHSPDEHEDRPGQTLATRSHEVIRHWADERKAVPATTTQEGEEPRVLRLNFPDYGGSSLREISWEAWFGPFDGRQLVFLYQEHKSDGSQSNFFRLDNPEREDG